jgi:hypothetical protein
LSLPRRQKWLVVFVFGGECMYKGRSSLPARVSVARVCILLFVPVMVSSSGSLGLNFSLLRSGHQNLSRADVLSTF